MQRAGLLQKYAELVRSNRVLVEGMQMAADSAFWLMPHRFAESEGLKMEIISAVLGLSRLINSSLIYDDKSVSAGQPPRWDKWLEAIAQVEAVVELAGGRLERSHGVSKYTALSVLEAIKASLRIISLFQGGGRILLDSGRTPPEVGSRHAAQTTARAACDAFLQFRQAQAETGGLAQQQDRQGVAPQPTDRGVGDASNQAAAWADEFAVQEGCKTQREQVHVGASMYWWHRPAEPYRPASALQGPHPSPSYKQQQQAVDKQQAAVELWQCIAAQLVAAGELAFILRPVVYTLALRRWGAESWKPWLLSLAVELGAAQLNTAGVMASRTASARLDASSILQGSTLALLYSLQTMRWNERESQELHRRRRLLLLWYLLRTPFFDRYTRPGLTRMESSLRRVPLLGSAVAKLTELLEGAQQFYTYTSGS